MILVNIVRGPLSGDGVAQFLVQALCSDPVSAFSSPPSVDLLSPLQVPLLQSLSAVNHLAPHQARSQLAVMGEPWVLPEA